MDTGDVPLGATGAQSILLNLSQHDYGDVAMYMFRHTGVKRDMMADIYIYTHAYGHAYVHMPLNSGTIHTRT